MSSDPQEETIFIGEYLLKRLSQLNVRSMFGVPGDFTLGFLDLVEDSEEIEWIGNCNELNASYAADGYARVAQSCNSKCPGVVCTTFGVGELSAINGMAGSFSEHIPVLQIVGVPSTTQLESKPLIHHTLGGGRYDAYITAAKQFTIAQAVLTDTQSAAADIDRVITECIIRARPVYLALPTDLVYAKIPSTPLKIPLDLELPQNEPEAESDVLNQIVDLVEKAAGNVVILVDACALRHHSVQEVRDFVMSTEFPVYSAPMGKSIISESHERFGGIYAGQATSRPDILKLVECSQLVVSIGAILSDFNTGNFSYHLPIREIVNLYFDHTKIGLATFHGVGMRLLLPKLTQRLKTTKSDRSLAPVPQWRSRAIASRDDNEIISHAWLWPTIGSFLKEADIVIAETGTTSFGALEICLPPRCIYVSQLLWGSIGFALGATLGASMAARERNLGRVIVFIGDGSIQLTVQEISTIMKWNLKPIIFILNNEGYTIERHVRGKTRKYNDIRKWKWTQLLSVFGGVEDQTCRSYTVGTKGELATLLYNNEFAKADLIQVVEVLMEKLDAPASLLAGIGVPRVEKTED